jgi:hypothetical protein
VAALYAETSRDEVIIETVSDLGQITSNLSNPIRMLRLNALSQRASPSMTTPAMILLGTNGAATQG